MIHLILYGTKIETATKLKGLIVEKCIGCFNFNSLPPPKAQFISLDCHFPYSIGELLPSDLEFPSHNDVIKKAMNAQAAMREQLRNLESDEI